MSRYPSDDVRRFDQQFAGPDRSERENDRLHKELARLRAANAALAAALRAAKGYLMNARIDLETGATKRTAINTINGGVKVIDEALAKHGGQS